MLSVLKPTEFQVKSLTTIATPHRHLPPVTVLIVVDPHLQIMFYRILFRHIQQVQHGLPIYLLSFVSYNH